MKKYYSLGELLSDYRKENHRSQSDLAMDLGVDVRTIARWESNDSLVKPDKEEDMVEKTFIPYQVIRNLNAAVPLPVYYDFNIRKYSHTTAEQAFPDAQWFAARRDLISERVRLITKPEEVEDIVKYHGFLYQTEKPVSKSLIRQAAQVLPGLNYILYDTAGFYAGHHVVFPVSETTFLKLRNREMVEGELRETHLINYKAGTPPIFYGYSVYADCNENFYYLLAKTIQFMRQLQAEDYLYGGLLVRPDALQLVKQIGLKIVWEDKEEQSKLKMLAPPTFLEGKFNHHLLGD